MVVTLKDGTVMTLFDVKETKDIIGDELYDFITSNTASYIDEIYERDVCIDDLQTEIYNLEETMQHVKVLSELNLEKLISLNNKYKDPEIEKVIKRLEDCIIHL